MKGPFISAAQGVACVNSERIVTIFTAHRDADEEHDGSYAVSCSIAEVFSGPTYRLAEFPETEEGYADAYHARLQLTHLLMDDDMAGLVIEWNEVSREWGVMDPADFIEVAPEEVGFGSR